MTENWSQWKLIFLTNQSWIFVNDLFPLIKHFYQILYFRNLRFFFVINLFYFYTETKYQTFNF